MLFLVINEEFSNKIVAVIVERVARLTLEHESVPWEDNSLTLVITGDQQIKALNLQYRGVNAPTDVLSFPASYPDPDSATNYLGDVLISFPRAEAQAREAGHLVEQELLLLVVHGILHLLGHDHAKPGDEKQMWAAQAEILDLLGIPINPLSNLSND